MAATVRLMRWVPLRNFTEDPPLPQALEGKADRAYQCAGATVRTLLLPSPSLPERYQQYNRDHARLRAWGPRWTPVSRTSPSPDQPLRTEVRLLHQLSPQRLFTLVKSVKNNRLEHCFE
jgi:hypothetical protein